jgi:glutamate/aspartate transport system substrate-binding protein
LLQPELSFIPEKGDVTMKNVTAQNPKDCFLAACIVASLSIVSVPGKVEAQEIYGTLKKINDSNKITIGHRESSIPFSYYDEKKQPVGYAMDLCNRVVDEVKIALKKPGIQVDYLMVTAQTRIPMVVDQSIDMECGSTTNTLSRQQQVDFSAVYFTTGTRMLARKALKAREIEDLQSRSIGVVGGSTNERAIKAMIDSGKLQNIRLTVLKDYADGLAAVETNSVDAFATDDIVLYGLLSKSRVKDELEVIGRLLTYDPYGIMVRRDDSAFRLVVNRALANAFRSGEAEKIYAKWFDPIGVPISPFMKAAFALQALPE